VVKDLAVGAGETVGAVTTLSQQIVRPSVGYETAMRLTIGQPVPLVAQAITNKKRRLTMVAQHRTTPLSPRSILLALAVVILVVLALAGGYAIRIATATSATPRPAATTVHGAASNSGALTISGTIQRISRLP
jgi:hypothetical protein